MGFSLYPSVSVREIDATTSVPAVATSIGATAGAFNWGPVEEIALIGSESDLVTRFGKPDATNYKDWFTAANFLAYGNQLKVVRAIGAGAANANDLGTNVLVKNLADFEANSAIYTQSFIAKYPGTNGNDITVDVSTATSYGSTDISISAITGAFTVGETITGGTSAATGVVTKVTSSKLTVGSVVGTFVSAETITGGTSAATATTGTIEWTYSSDFPFDPTGTELLVVILKGGVVVEKFVADSDPLAKNFQGDSTFIENILARKSAYVWAANGATITGKEYTFTGGLNGATLTDADYIRAFNLFADANSVDINLLMQAGASSAVGVYLIQSIAEVRKDCVAFVSPTEADALVPTGNALSISASRKVGGQLNVSSSYGVMDGNYKYQYDRYNDVFRWLPFNGDIAGLCARTDDVADSWFSPAGLIRGSIKNVVKTAFNPDAAAQAELYKNAINPIVTFAGEGTVLFGDKTMQTRPSAFDRINVRRLFIFLEKAIATMAKYSLFEFNDAFTRARFVQSVEPFLRNIKGRRGIYDFYVQADEKNNTGAVIDANEFVGDIYVKPPHSINFIQLNFTAVKTAVDFKEIIG